MRNLLLFLLLLLPMPALAQEAAPDTAIHLGLLAHWDNDSLPAIGNQTWNDVWGWTDEQGREFVILGSIDSIYFFDITNPREPVLCDVQAGRASGTVHRDFKTYKHYAYAVADEGFSSLQIFDLQYLPDSVVKVYDSNVYSLRAHNIFIENEKLYLASNTRPGGFYPMTVLSLENPEMPTLVNSLVAPVVNGQPLFTVVHDVYVKNDTAYCSAGNEGLFIYDYSETPENPELIGQLPFYPYKGYNHSSWRTDNGQVLVFADETHGMKLKTLSLEDYDAPNVMATFGVLSDLGSIPHNPIIRGNIVYISYYHLGVQAFDISDPENPRYYAGFDTYPQDTSFRGYQGCWGIYPLFPSGVIAASDMSNGLFLLKPDTVLPEDPDVVTTTLVYPNPFEEYFTVRFEVNRKAAVTLTLYDLLGHVVLHKTRVFDYTPFPIEWEVPEAMLLSEGMYILQLDAGDHTSTMKLLKD